MECPRCQLRLNRTTTEHGVCFCCPQCHGRALGVAPLRRFAAKESVREIWRRARLDEGTPGPPCPICCQAMTEVSLPDSQPPLRLDVCTRCEFVWFDAREFEQLPPSDADAPKRLPAKAREVIALETLRREKEREQAQGFGQESPEELWKVVPAVFGLPIEHDAPAVQCWPWLTYGLAAALAVVFVATAENIGAVVEEFGLVPAQLWRHHGATFVTSFFLHADFWHLLGNVYFLLIFGDNVEDDLGHWGCAALLAIAALVGDMCHIIGDPQSAIPCIGASGGISGVITYYALRYPRARLGFLFRWWFYFRWLQMPAYVALLLWFLLQFWYVAEQRMGAGNVAALAHLGGAAVGAVVWLLWRSGSRWTAQVV